VKPWVVRVFDPRPPWWQRLTLYSTLALVIYCYLEQAQLFKAWRSVSKIYQIELHDSSDQHVGNVFWTYNRRISGFTENIAISEPKMLFGRSCSPVDPYVFLASDDPMANDVIEKFRAKDFSLSGDALMYYDSWPKWMDDGFAEIQRSGFSGSLSRTRWFRAAAWYGLLGVGLAAGILLLGRSYVRMIVSRRYHRCIAGLCSSCSYNLDGARSSICPECGLKVRDDRKLLELLHMRGYRGLRRFMEIELEGVAT